MIPRMSRRVFWDLGLLMVGLGLAMGIAFPFFMLAIGFDSDRVFRPIVFVATIGAGLVVGGVNFFLARSVVGSRLRVLRDRMDAVEEEVRAPKQGTDHTFAVDDVVIPVDSEDELGDCAQAFNRLVESLAESREHEHTAHETLIQQEKLISLGTLSAAIAHELKNPLNFIMNFAQLNREMLAELEELVPDRDGEVQELLNDLSSNSESIANSGKRARDIITSMLMSSRSRAPAQLEPTDVNELVERNASLAYHGVRARDVEFSCTIEYDLDPALPQVHVDQADLGRVIINLVTNACQAVAEKRARVADNFDPAITVRTRRLANTAEIRIRDNGSGIPDSVRKDIFDPFFTTKPPGDGTGLGLSIAHDVIVEEHHGRIDVVSESGEYTEFEIEIPLEYGHRVTSSAPPA